MCLTPMLSRALTKTSATVCDISASHVNLDRPQERLKREWNLNTSQIAVIAYYGIHSTPGAYEVALLLRLWWGGKTHEMRGDAKPAAVTPLVNIRVTPIRCFASEPYIPVTGMYDGDVAQNPHHHIHRLGMRARIGIGDALEERFAIQQDAVRRANVEVLRKILRVPPHIR